MYLVLFLTFLFSTLFCYLTLKYRIFPKSFLDLPDKIRKKHLHPVPKLGIIFFLPLVILFDNTNSTFEYSFHFIIFCLIFIIIGILDDIISIKWVTRIFYESVVILSYILLNQEFILYELNINNPILEDIIKTENFYYLLFFTGFCFVALINALNFYDGINNQLSQYLIILFLFFYIKTLNPIFIILIIILIIYSIFNYQSKVFFGSASVYFIAFLLFNFSIFYHNTNIIGADEIFLMLLYPGLDMTRLFFSRMFKKNSPFKADRNHVHHILSLKYSQRMVVFINNIPVIFCLICSQIPFINNLYGLVFVILYYILILNINKKT